MWPNFGIGPWVCQWNPGVTIALFNVPPCLVSIKKKLGWPSNPATDMSLNQHDILVFWFCLSNIAKERHYTLVVVHDYVLLTYYANELCANGPHTLVSGAIGYYCM